MKGPVTIFWLRRDLRLHDSAALFRALELKLPVVPVFIFDPDILGQLENKADRRVHFIHQVVSDLNRRLNALGTTLLCSQERPLETFARLLGRFDVQSVVCSEDYEPYARQRDHRIAEFLREKGITFYACKDQVVLRHDEVLKEDGTPYTVFTPYSRRWKQKLGETEVPDFSVSLKPAHFFPLIPEAVPSLSALGFRETGIRYEAPDLPTPDFLKNYNELRNFPSLNGTSRLGIHLRFGTVSIRELVRLALRHSDTFLNELIWRDFYMAILFHFPRVAREPFKKEYKALEWRHDEEAFRRWTEGRTGFPIVDAGMRELRETGYMHNRVRMITASFLVKDLLIDYRWGEAWFAAHLDDFELSSNNGGWQWAAGTGCDAAPYFRIFNPLEQQKKFDPRHEYIRRWVKDYDSTTYPSPMVDHAEARLRALQVYKEALRKNGPA